jgi:prepilin-type N-terminal cleavage/methylation domain-containing protein
MIERHASKAAPHRGGFNALEVMSALAILSIATSFAAELPRGVLRRERVKSAAREIQSVVLATRMEAVRRNTKVVLHVDLEKRELTSWAERGVPNFVQDPGEKTITRYGIPGSVLFRGADGRVDGPDAVSFDTYAGDRRLTDRLVFDGDGSLVSPQAENSRLPAKPRSYGPVVPYASVDCPPARCRGIFFSDHAGGRPGRNLFRVSVDGAWNVGRVSLLKWVPPEEGGNTGETDFAPSPWRWVD